MCQEEEWISQAVPPEIWQKRQQCLTMSTRGGGAALGSDTGRGHQRAEPLAVEFLGR